ncbi:MAG: ABC transporter substrate-binding protein [Deltaproteobacteria bacterium]|nr:ABC transporter substrate-binding protein [Deltaproteobacteria bacterium]
MTLPGWLRFAVITLIAVDFLSVEIVRAEKIRVVMPSKSMTYLNFYIGERFGIYKAEGLEVAFEVMKPDIGVAAMVAGEIDYMTGIGSILRAAIAGAPVKAAMFTMDRVIFFMMAKPEIRSIQDLKGGTTVAVSGVVATDAHGARTMAKAHGLNPDKDLVLMAIGDAGARLAALQGGSIAVAMLSIPFNFKAEEMGFRNLGGTAEYMRTPFAGVGASNIKLRSNASQVKRMLRATLKGMEYTRDPANLQRVIAYAMEQFRLDRKTAELSYREIIKAFTKDGTSPDEAVKAEIEFLSAQTKPKGRLSLNQLVDYTLLKEVMPDLRR